MKSMLQRRYFVALVGLVTLIACTPADLNPRVTRESVTAYAPPAPQEWHLANGLTIKLIEDNELPVVQGSLLIKGGTLWEPAQERGVVSAMGSLMRQGGAGERSADNLDLELEKLSAAVSSGFGNEFGRVSFYSLASDLDQVFSILADVVLRPRFEADRLVLWKGQALEGIRRRKDDPSTIASLSLNELLYGDTPYGSLLVGDDVAHITREEIVRAHEKFVLPQGAVLAVSGSVSRARLEALVARHFAAWRAIAATLTPPPVTGEPAPGIYFIKAPFQQATIIAGELGVERLSPDYVAIEAFNEILSGNFASRLFARIRTELGLAYSVYGGIQAGVVRGVNTVSLQTKSESAGGAISEVYRALERLQREPPDLQELRDVQRSIENSFVFKFSSSEKRIERAALLQMLNYPPGYDSYHLAKVAALTPNDVQQVAQRRWDLSKFVIVVVGNESAYTSLESLRNDPSATLRQLPIHVVEFDQKLKR